MFVPREVVRNEHCELGWRGEEGSMVMPHLCMPWLNFILGLILIIFCFLFWGMVMFDNEFKTKENKN